jgi:two-component system, response regulator PdtaR
MTSPLRIVIADDDEEIRHYFRRLLDHLGHRVVGEAANGVELVELCRSEQPDLVITDVRMPRGDGIEAGDEIANAQAIPVIIVSGHDRPDNIADCGNVVDFLVKPVKLTDLDSAIRRAFSPA